MQQQQQQQQAYGYGAPQNNALYGRSLAEVEGNNRSKAQLIVGIDFVSCDRVRFVKTVTNNVCRARLSRVSPSRSPLIQRPKRISSLSGQVLARKQSRRWDYRYAQLRV